MGKKYLEGGKLAGGNSQRGRVDNDFYATDPDSTRGLLNKVHFEGNKFLEPCCGEGHICKVIQEYYPNVEITAIDIVDRGYGEGGVDFLTYMPNDKFDNVITKYNPQMVEGKPYKKTGDYSSQIYGMGKIKKQGWNDGTRYPFNILQFKADNKKNGHYHPSQKPVPLLEYLIRTYTNEGDTVLDNCMGSGSTGVACKNLNRNFIGIELEKKYFDIAKERIENTNNRVSLW